ncbi:MAG TPA: hypothetical protein DCQ09_04485 [Alcanivorax sp.]|nr:hypothetical protein [Haliea sp.]HAM74902.1 hypothetical protein [Alcanivorax sp.]|tara:strand:- start:4611 stop:5513 length:903 start_codon:yes stop_codon:yes gene_type:complete
MIIPADNPRRDITGQVALGDVAAVMAEVGAILEAHWPGGDWSALDVLSGLFSQLYTGEHPEYHGCDAGYHDTEHVLDVTLAMARLMAGREKRWPGPWAFAADLALAGVASALFHDAGYLRRRGDRRNSSGAAYTRTHVRRGAALIRAQFPRVGLTGMAPVCARLVHFTNCHRKPEHLTVRSRQEWQLGALLGTADLLAQLAAPDYLEKCRHALYDEFVASGMAAPEHTVQPEHCHYRSRDDLLRRTPGFVHGVAGSRLERDFAGAYHYASSYFEGENPYLESIAANCARLDQWLAPRPPA